MNGIHCKFKHYEFDRLVSNFEREMNQKVLVKKLDKIAKGKGFLSGPSDPPLALENLLWSGSFLRSLRPI